MDAAQIANVLDTQQTGVLSLARENDSYCIPVSFAFAEDEQNVYLRLGYGQTSTKRQFVEAVDQASFLVYDKTADGWKSVLARGSLEDLSQDSLDSTHLEAVKNLHIPYFRVHGVPAGDPEFTIARIEVTELTGIASGGAGPD